MNNLLQALSDPPGKDTRYVKKKRSYRWREADAFNISKPSISHHLDILKRANLVASQKEGQFITYSINTTELDELIKWIYQLNGKRKNNNTIKQII